MAGTQAFGILYMMAMLLLPLGFLAAVVASVYFLYRISRWTEGIYRILQARELREMQQRNEPSPR